MRGIIRAAEVDRFYYEEVNMADESSSSLESKIAALHTKIERESRFTRSLVVICTAAVLGVSLVPIKIMLTDLPNLLWSNFESNLDTMHKHWKILDRTNSGTAAPDSAAAPESTSTAADKK